MSIRRNSAYMLGSQLSSVLFGMVSSVIVSRVLGPEARGVFILSNLVVQFALTLGTLGVGSALTYQAGKRLRDPAMIVGASVLWGIGLGVPIAIGVGLAGPLLLGSLLQGLTTQHVWVAAAGIPAAFVGHFASNVLLGLNRVEHVALTQAGMGFVNMVAPIYVLILSKGGVDEMILASTLIWFIAAAWTLYLAVSKLGFRLDHHIATHGETLRYGLAAYLGFVSNQFWLRADTLILNALSGPGAVGQYSLSVSLAERIWIVDSSIGQAVYPSIVGGGHDAAVELITRTCRLLTLMTGASALLLGASSPWLIPLLYGRAYEPAIAPLLLLLPGVVALALARVLAGYFSGQLGRPGIATKVSIAVMLVGLGLYSLLVPAYGSVGAAAGSSLAYVASLVMYLGLFSRFTGRSAIEPLLAGREEIALIVTTFRSAVRRVWPGGTSDGK